MDKSQQPQKKHLFSDLLQIAFFILCVVVGFILINTFVFQSFTVEGASMEKTLYTGDRLIVNRLPSTISSIQGNAYVPERGQVIVFKNPQFNNGLSEEFIVKRVIAFAGERVVLKDGKYTVYNKDHPNGFNPDDENHGEPGSPTAGTVDVTVADDSLFVSGDHRQLDKNDIPYSMDSRNGLGYIPLYDVIGPVSARIFPFQDIRSL